VAALLHPLDPRLAGAVTREALLTAWLGGRAALMEVVATAPLGDLDPGLPSRLAVWIPEVDAWWAEPREGEPGR
jgi:hypothetical protein